MHGTWAAPQPNQVRWYQRVDRVSAPDAFVLKLDSELQKRGSSARTWAHCSGDESIYQWSGENSWVARTHAAAELADYIVKLQNDGWLCHIVAHSHGGNVALEALEQIFAPLGERRGSLVTLGTPFIDTISPIEKRARKLRKVTNFLWRLGFVSLILLVLGAFWWAWAEATVIGLAIGIGGLVTLTHIILAPWATNSASIGKAKCFETLRTRAPPRPIHEFTQSVFKKRTLGSPTEIILRQTPCFVLGSSMDEAWQVLHHMRSVENPLIERGPPGWLSSAIRLQMLQGADIARIHGAKSYKDVGIAAKACLALLHLVFFAGFALILPAVIFSEHPHDLLGKSYVVLLLFFVLSIATLIPVIFATAIFGTNFYSAFFAPFRWLVRSMSLWKTVPVSITKRVVLRRSWSILLELALGMQGYRFSLPVVERVPRRIPEEFIKYEDMPSGAELRALNKRSKWVLHNIGGASQTFAKMVITAQDVSTLLDTIERDQSLVHAAYYTDDECIAQIADWIAGTG